MGESSNRSERNMLTEDQDLALGNSEVNAGVGQSLTEDEIARLKRVQKRNFIVAIVLGIILMISGYFAGQHVREMRSDTSRGIVQSISSSECDA
ncbi:hypothetical protein [Arcanobacterium ihumii]|uniref:hypothetical protein n=1 Tax=Arcanobacterium ihumii TaxID=2138162 RepID=UPI001F283501|nr:hypothetical protein [Arcanobacterium ihumii]